MWISSILVNTRAVHRIWIRLPWAMGILVRTYTNQEYAATLQTLCNGRTLTILLRQFCQESWIIYSHPAAERGGQACVHPHQSLHRKTGIPT
jgi:hypothetical protein